MADQYYLQVITFLIIVSDDGCVAGPSSFKIRLVAQPYTHLHGSFSRTRLFSTQVPHPSGEKTKKLLRVYASQFL